METIKDLERKHQEEMREFRENCPHKCVKVEDYSNFHYGRSVVLRCVVCETPIVGWDGSADPSYSTPSKGEVTFAHGFVKLRENRNELVQD